MANDDQEQWYLPESLRLSNPRVAAEAADLRNRLKDKVISPFARLSPLEFGRLRAAARIPHLSEAIQQVEAELQRPTGRATSRQLLAARTGLLIRLAENYALAGRPDIAAEIEPREDYKRQYAAQVRDYISNSKL